MSFLSPEAPEEGTCTQGQDCQPESTDVEELKVYFSLPDASLNTDPLEWWPKHEKLLPSLSRMARQFLGVHVPASSEGGPETGLILLDHMLRQLMVHHSVVNKFPKGFCIKIIFSHRKSHSELFRMFRMFRIRFVDKP